MSVDSQRPATARREAIAYHQAGHAVVGQAEGLRVSRIYVGDACGRVVFDDESSEEAVLGDAALLDRYAMMLLAATSAEWRHSGTVQAGADLAALNWLLRRARARGTVPRPDRWRRADAEAVRHWSAIEAVADELAHRSAPTADLDSVLAQDPQLGTTVDEVSGARLRELIAAPERERPGPRRLGASPRTGWRRPRR